MTSMRFAHAETQGSEFFKELIHAEDRRREEFVSQLPPEERSRWGRDGAAAMSTTKNPGYVVLIDRPSSGSMALQQQQPHFPAVKRQQSVQLFSKRMKKPEHSRSGRPLPPVTHQTLDTVLINDPDDKPNHMVFPSAEYVRPTRASVVATSTQTGSSLFFRPRVSSPASPPTGAVSSAPAECCSSKVSTPACTSIFSHGSSSLARHLHRRHSTTPNRHHAKSCGGVKAASGATGDPSNGRGSTSTGTTVSIRHPNSITSSQHEKLRSMSERLSRVEHQVEESLQEEAQVTHTLEELKHLVLSLSQPTSPKRGGV